MPHKVSQTIRITPELEQAEVAIPAAITLMCALQAK